MVMRDSQIRFKGFGDGHQFLGGSLRSGSGHRDLSVRPLDIRARPPGDGLRRRRIITPRKHNAIRKCCRPVHVLVPHPFRRREIMGLGHPLKREENRQE